MNMMVSPCNCGCSSYPCACQPCPPYPPPAIPGLRGVTDGSQAKAGQVGEVITQTYTGTITTAAPTALFQVITLPPGDWDVRSWLVWQDNVWPAGVFVTAMALSLFINNNTLTADSLSGSFPAGSGFASSYLKPAVIAVSVAAPTLITGQFIAVGPSAGLNLQFTVDCQCRRMR